MSSWSKKVKIEIRATNVDRKVSRFNILVTYSHSIGEISTGLKKTCEKLNDWYAPKNQTKKKQQQQQGLSQTQGLNPRTLTTKFNSNKHGATSSFID